MGSVSYSTCPRALFPSPAPVSGPSPADFPLFPPADAVAAVSQSASPRYLNVARVLPAAVATTDSRLLATKRKKWKPKTREPKKSKPSQVTTSRAFWGQARVLTAAFGCDLVAA